MDAPLLDTLTAGPPGTAEPPRGRLAMETSPQATDVRPLGLALLPVCVWSERTSCVALQLTAHWRLQLLKQLRADRPRSAAGVLPPLPQPVRIPPRQSGNVRWGSNENLGTTLLTLSPSEQCQITPVCVCTRQRCCEAALPGCLSVIWSHVQA